MTSTIDRIDAALDMTEAIVDRLSPTELGEPSLCAGWDRRFELNHLVGGMRIFAAELSRTGPERDHHDDWLGDDPRQAYASAATLDRAAWHRPSALDTTVRLSFGPMPGPVAALIHLTEVLVHGADLAVVAGVPHLIDDRLCEDLLGTMAGLDMEPFRQMGAFGPARPAAADAPAHLRLLAFLGRRL